MPSTENLLLLAAAAAAAAVAVAVSVAVAVAVGRTCYHNCQQRTSRMYVQSTHYVVPMCLR